MPALTDSAHDAVSRVGAFYDREAPRMVARLSANYAAEVRSGAIVPAAFPFASSPEALPGRRPFDAIAANFAVINLVAEPGALLGQFARLLRPGGTLVLNVLNAYYWRDLRYGWWWRALVAGRRTGTLCVDGADSPTYRHRVPTIVRGAAPEPAPVARHGGPLGHFAFLVFRRRA